MASFPILKRVQSHRFELVDLLDYYRNLYVWSPKGNARVLKVNRKEDTVLIEVLKTKKQYIFKPRQIKLLLRPLSGIKTRDLKIISNLALNTEGFTFSVNRTGSRISCVGERYLVNVNLKPRFSMSIEDTEGYAYDVANIGFVTSYLSQQGFDLFNVLSTSYARLSKQQGV